MWKSRTRWVKIWNTLLWRLYSLGSWYCLLSQSAWILSSYLIWSAGIEKNNLLGSFGKQDDFLSTAVLIWEVTDWLQKQTVTVLSVWISTGLLAGSEVMQIILVPGYWRWDWLKNNPWVLVHLILASDSLVFGWWLGSLADPMGAPAKTIVAPVAATIRAWPLTEDHTLSWAYITLTWWTEWDCPRAIWETHSPETRQESTLALVVKAGPN